MREIIHSTSQDEKAKNRNLEILNLDPNKNLYGLLIDNKMFLASLCELPNIIEGQKTLDFKTFYKSVDVAQILYVHSKTVDEVQQKSPEELIKIAKDYNPVLEDQEFLNNLYRRGETKKMVEEQKAKGEEIKYETLKFRHGLAPVSKNIRNIRHKKEPNEDPDEVHAVETILKDIIDYGFADNVEEDLLDFDDQGNLVKVTKGAKEKRRDDHTSSRIKLDLFGDLSARSESNYRGNPYYGMDGQSSMYSGQVDQYDDGGTSYHPESARDQSSYMEYPPPQQQQNYPQIQFQQPQTPQSQTISISFGGQQQQPYNQQQYQQQYGQQQNQQINYSQDQTMIDQQQQQQLQQNQPMYTQQDYQQMKSDLKGLKKLIKETQQDMNNAMQSGADVNRIRDYYRSLVTQKESIKQQKKIAKRQLRSQTLQ